MSTLLSTLTAYAPALITRRFAADPSPLTEPLAEQFSAAVLFADISGFTALAERLAQRGLVGAETLSRILKDYFGQLTDLIAEHGGDVVKFAGDALLAVWLAPLHLPPLAGGDREGGLREATLRAAQCALAVQAKLHDTSAADGARLSMRIGIGAGDVATAHIGGVFGRWEFVVVGPAIAQVSLAEQRARPGEVVLSSEAWAEVKDACEVAPLAAEAGSPSEARPFGNLKAVRSPLPPRPAVYPELSAEAESALKAYVPGAILARLAAGQSGWMAELRRVTVLFINLRGFGQNTSLDESHALMRDLQDAIYRYEGSINKLNVDDKGVTLVAALGLPPFAHEDDPARGVLVALAVHAKLDALGMRHAIGVTTGRVFCGSVGGERRREYTMHADIVNLSARLMQAALLLPQTGGEPEGGGAPILCDEGTYQATRVRIEFETLPAVTVKGKAAPVAVYRPLRETRVAAHPPAEMVGRAHERAILAEALQTLVSGQTAGVIVVEGEPGIGKSRLVDEARRQAHALGLTALSGAGDAVEKKSAYHGWRGVFAELFRLEALTDPAARREHVAAALGPELLERAPLLNDLLPLDFPENDLTRQMIGEARAESTREVLVTLLRAAVAQAPKVMILEDTHWLDSASWALALDVSQRVRPLLLLIATRPVPEPLPAEYARLLSWPDTTRLSLQPLPADEALTLVRRRLGVTGLPAPVAALIREKAEGNPFFSEELAYALRDSGLIQMSGSECRLAAGVDLKAVAFPDTVQGVITSRIDRLPPPQQLALKVASVIGRIFAFRILRDIYPIEDDRLFLKDYLQTLEQLDLTPLDAPEPDLAYVFKHIITQEVAYNLMLFAQRRDLHRAAAEWFERSYPDDLSPYYPLLAYHWSKAEDHEKTVEYLEKAGEQAIQGGAYQEAIGFFSEVLKAAADDSRHPLPVTRRAHWERLLGEAQYSLGNLAESRRHLERALAWLGRPIPETRGGLVLSLLAEVGRTAFRVLRPNRSTGRVEAARPDLLEAYRACEAVISPYVLTNEAPRLILAGLRFGNLADMIGPSPEMARGFAGAGFFFGLVPLHGLAQAQQARGLQIAESQNDLPALARVLFFVGLYNYGLGEWAKSREALSRAREINGRLGARRQWDESSGILAQAIFAQGEFETSAQIEAQIDASARQRGDMQAHLYQLIAQSEVVLRLGRPGHADEAVALMEEATTVPAQGLDQSGQMRAYAILALARLRRGEAHLAREAADRALAAILNTPPTSCWTLEGYAGAAETYLSLIETRANRSPAERRALAKFARQAIGALRQFARVFPIGQPRAWLFQGFYDWLDGKPAKARQAWRKGLAAAQKLAMPYDEALAHFEIGRHASGDERRDHLDRAADIFKRLGAEYDLQRAQAEIKTP